MSSKTKMKPFTCSGNIWNMEHITTFSMLFVTKIGQIWLTLSTKHIFVVNPATAKT